MKNAILTLVQLYLLHCLMATGLQAQNCTFTDLRLNTQAAVNGFNQSCVSVKGNIIVAGADITDLTPLKNIETIDGSLTIQNNPILPSLTGLEKLSFTKHLLILTNDLLTDLSGLEGLTSIGSITYIKFNKKLVSLNGLDNLTNASIFHVTNNDALADLTGLGSLESISDVILISSNKSLASLNGLTSLTNVSRILIGENDILPDLSGLEALGSVNYQMHVSSNKSLVSFNGLNNLTTLSEMYISDNNLMTDMSGLESVSSVKWLVIGESQGLTSLNGLHNLINATNFIIRDNNLLTDLSGLEGLTTVGWLKVSGNTELVSLTGLGPAPEGLRLGANARVAALTIGGLELTDNPKLTTCAIEPVCDFIGSNFATISGNGTGCERQSAVQTACASLPVTLAEFTALKENRTALLQWTTTEESNSSVFAIEHSLDGQTWQKAGEHAAKGESNKLVNYQWVHRAPVGGLNYYRLKMIDLDGSHAYSRIINLEFDGIAESNALIYPNPVSDMLLVGDRRDILQLRIINQQGKTMYEIRNVPDEGLSVKKLTAGLYQVHITRQSGKVQTEHILVP